MSAAMVAAALPRACLVAAALAVIVLLRRVLATVARRLALGATGRVSARVQSHTLSVTLRQEPGGGERTLRVPLPDGSTDEDGLLSTLLSCVTRQLAVPAKSLTVKVPNIVALQDSCAVGAFARVTRRVHMSEGKGKPERTTLELAEEPLCVTALLRTPGAPQDGCARARPQCAGARGAVRRQSGAAPEGRATQGCRAVAPFFADATVVVVAPAAASTSSRCRWATRTRPAAWR
jgi:hypothetical protein